MKKKLLSLSLTVFSAFHIYAQTTVTVSAGAGYANQKWYSLENGEQGSQAKDNWDIAFEITGYSSAILANTQKPNFAIYKTPYSVANYATLDTAGIGNWPTLYNSDTSWTIGAFNRGANPADAYDLGWGLYDINTHFVTGDSCYVIKVSATSYKKLKLINLANGTYNFEYADINGSASQTIALNKSTYTGKNFAYFDMTANTAIDREPASSAWDLTFVKYTAFIPIPYPVVGILSNKGVTVAQANNVSNVSTYSNWSSESFQTNISEIGSDWKSFDLNTNAWKLVNDTCYFVKDKSSNLWKLRFTGFGGSTDGNIILSKEKISSVGIASNKNTIANVAVYPNPSSGDNTNLLFSADKAFGKVAITITDMNGKIMSAHSVEVAEGLNTYPLNTSELNSGLYFIHLNAGAYTTTQKLIKN